MRVLFWGTPEFALPSLRALESEGHAVVGVITQPDRPAGRGRRLRPSPVKEWSTQEGYDILEPELPWGDSFVARISELRPEVSVVVAYGHILRPEVLAVPTHGSINVHASYLPGLRGAAPVNWAIIRGLDVTGVTIMRMVEAMDAGPILLQAQEPIYPRDSATSLGARLAEIGAELLIEVLAMLEVGMQEEREQDHSQATFAPKVGRDTARVDWTRPAETVANLIRGMDALPGAWSTLQEVPIKLFRPAPAREAPDGDPGRILDPGSEGGLLVACGEGAAWIEEVQPPGKRRMGSAEWMRGRGASVGQRFT